MNGQTVKKFAWEDYLSDWKKVTDMETAEGHTKYRKVFFIRDKLDVYKRQDVVLMLAEAINEQGFKQEAVDLVNSVRERAGAALLQTTDAGCLLYTSGSYYLRLERLHQQC